MSEPFSGSIFLSHNATDKPEVERLARRLLDRGLRPWLDKWEIQAGRSWQQALQSAIEGADALIVCLGPHGLGRVQIPEVEAALQRTYQDPARAVLPVILPGASEKELPPYLAQRGAVDLGSGEPGYRALFALLERVRPARSPPTGDPLWEGEAPFRGLEAFDERHARWFFGRESEVARLLDALRASRLLVLIGPSGSGKSSLVRAGLLPAVRTGELDHSYAWEPLLLRPGPHPLQALARCAAQACTSRRVDEAALTAELERSPERLADELDREAVWGAAERRFLLVVDQFEELFALCANLAQRAAFVAAILHTAQAAGGRTHVICTLRADFLAQVLGHPGLAEALHGSHQMLGRMSQAGLRAAIRRPALIAGLQLEPGLEDLLVHDVWGEPGDLPLLQFALEELWQQREDGRFTLLAYRRMGGVRGAIARRADAELATFSAPQRAQLRRLFGRLVQLGEGAGDTRRRLAVAELTGAHPELGPPLEALIRARLLTAYEDEVEVTHEALIREWGELRRWIEADREVLRVQQELARAAALWARSGDAADLWGGARLVRAAELRSGDWLTLSVPEQRFLDAALEHAAHELRAAEQRRQRELQAARALARSRALAARRLRFGLASALVLLLAVGGVSTLARRAQGRAERARAAAQRTVADGIGVAQVLVQTASTELGDLTGVAGVRQNLIESGEALLDRLAAGADATTRQALLRSRAAFYSQRAELAWRQADLPTSQQHYERALALREELLAHNAADPDVQQDLALELELLARVFDMQGKLPAARAQLERARAIRERVVAEHGERRDARFALARSRRSFGRMLRFGDKATAQRELALAAETLQGLLQETPEDLDVLDELTQCYRGLADVAFLRSQFAESERHAELALQTAQRMVALRPESRNAHQQLAMNYEMVGLFSAELGRLDRARAGYEHAIGLAEELNQQDATRAEHRYELAARRIGLGMQAVGEGRLGAARAPLEQGVEALRDLIAHGQSGASYDFYLLLGLKALARLEWDEGELGQAFEDAARSAELGAGIVFSSSSGPRAVQAAVQAQRLAGAIALERGAPAEARRQLQAARERAQQLADTYPDDPWLQFELADCSAELSEVARVADQPREALQLASDALERARRAAAASPDTPRYALEQASALQRVAAALASSAERAGARARLEEAGALLSALPTEYTVAGAQLAAVHGDLAQLALAAGDAARARVHGEAALASQEGIVQRDPGNDRAQLALLRARAELAALARAERQPADARAQLDALAAGLERLDAAGRSSPAQRLAAARLAQERAELARLEGEPAAARSWLARAVEQYGALALEQPEWPAAKRGLAQSRALLSE